MSEQQATPKPTRGFRRISRRDVEKRRTVLRSIVAGVAVVGVSMFGYFPILKQLFDRLRPPGALAEREFLSACIKCGQCVQVCPVQAIKLADGDDGFGLGTPYIDARAQACDFSCDATQCVLACPTGALSHLIDTKEEVRMGVARLARPSACLAMKGNGFKGVTRGADSNCLHRYIEIDRWTPVKLSSHPYDLELCDLCLRECPIKGAITFEPFSSDPNDRRRIPTITDKCVGCGTCEMVCPVAPSAIVVDPKIIAERNT